MNAFSKIISKDIMEAIFYNLVKDHNKNNNRIIMVLKMFLILFSKMIFNTMVSEKFPNKI